MDVSHSLSGSSDVSRSVIFVEGFYCSVLNVVTLHKQVPECGRETEGNVKWLILLQWDLFCASTSDNSFWLPRAVPLLEFNVSFFIA